MLPFGPFAHRTEILGRRRFVASPRQRTFREEGIRFAGGPFGERPRPLAAVPEFAAIASPLLRQQRLFRVRRERHRTTPEPRPSSVGERAVPRPDTSTDTRPA